MIVDVDVLNDFPTKNGYLKPNKNELSLKVTTILDSVINAVRFADKKKKLLLRHRHKQTHTQIQNIEFIFH